VQTRATPGLLVTAAATSRCASCELDDVDDNGER
jgi:hypothetical protein